MSENSDVILAALTERMFQELGDRAGDSAASLVFSIAALASIIRSRHMSLDDASQLLEQIFSRIPLRYRTDAAAERMREATDWLRASVPADDFEGRTIDGSVKSNKRDNR